MIALARKNLAVFISKNTSPIFRSPFPYSFPLSTSAETHLGISPELFNILVKKHHFPPEFASRVATKLPYLENPERADSVLTFFKQTGFSNTQLMQIVRYRPRLLATSVDDALKPKIKIFQDFGFSSDAIFKIITTNPSILHLSANNNIIPSLSVMKGLLGSNDEVARVLKGAPRILSVNLENTVVPNIEFLKSCGIPMERIRIILTSYPYCFSIKPEKFRKSAEKANKMGLDTSSESFLYAIPAITKMSDKAWEIKLHAFRIMGFSDGDILAMFRKDPRVFSVSLEKIKKIKELLLATGKFDVLCIAKYPMSLGRSVEKRYKPRFQILGILESMNLIKNWPSLGTICSLTDAKFFNKYIRPYVDQVSYIDIPKNFVMKR